MKNIPIADCPRCGRIILYSSNPADKKLYKTEIANENYVGRFAKCNKYKSVVAILDAVYSLADASSAVACSG
jgi:hypothetical protein